MIEKRVHFIAMGGAVMHQLALHLHNSGNIVTGSDDVIFDPAYTNLQKHGILPAEMGWFSERVHPQLDAVILGMHAQKDNPELLQAQKLGLKIYSFPEFIYEQSKNKKRIVIGGSHGKTTTTSMIMHVLNKSNLDFDYLVGAQIKGFDYVVKTSESASCIIIEGDEYLTSPLDLRSKFLHYHPHLAILTGIAWDHINVFPTFEGYVDTFRKFIHSVQDKVFYFHDDVELQKLAQEDTTAQAIAYQPFESKVVNEQVQVVYEDQAHEVNIFGEHNMSNLRAAFHICQELGVSTEDFFKHIQSFEGAAKRLELLYEDKQNKISIYKDFAHAPSKVAASVKAIQERFADRKIIVALELHTYSSLQKDFIHQYKGSLDPADEACVFIDAENLKIKKREPIEANWLKQQFGNEQIAVFQEATEIGDWLQQKVQPNTVILLMSSGHWGGLELENIYTHKN